MSPFDEDCCPHKMMPRSHHICCSSAGKQHSSDFSRLIAQVRGRLETTRQARIKREVIAEGEDAPRMHSAGTATLITFS